MTMGVTVERFLAVHHPMEYNRRLQNSTHSHHLLTAICPLILFALAFNISKFFESEVKYDVVLEGQHNITQMYLDVTSIRKNDLYVTWYLNW